MPQITHRDLVAFANDRVNLKKAEVDDQRAQVNRLRGRIENKIATTPGYGFVKALHAGSVAKGTALRNGPDQDLAVYVTSDGDDVEQGWLKAFGGLLTPDETAILTLAATAEHRMSRHFDWQAPAKHEPGTEGDGDVGDTKPARERSPQQVLAEIADAYRQAVFDLLAGTRKRGDSSGPGPDFSHRADAVQDPAEPEAEDASQ